MKDAFRATVNLKINYESQNPNFKNPNANKLENL